jgi:long-subunit fatty acid transport protein
MLGAKAGYALTETWSVRAGVNYSHFEKNEVQVAAGVPTLVREAFNSNSDVYKATVDLNYATETYSFGPAASFLYRNRNGYDPTTFQFLPAKTSWGAGLNGSYNFSKTFTLTASVQRVWVREGENPTKLDALNAVIPGSGVPETSSTAWLASLGGTVKF